MMSWRLCRQNPPTAPLLRILYSMIDGTRNFSCGVRGFDFFLLSFFFFFGGLKRRVFLVKGGSLLSVLK